MSVLKRNVAFLVLLQLLCWICVRGEPNAQAATTGNHPSIPGFVYVTGGEFKDTGTNFSAKHVAITGFYIGKSEVSQKEWAEVMGVNPAHAKGDDLPVEMVSWYDCIEYCNKRSEKEGLTPYYQIDKTKKDPNNLKDPNFEGEFGTEKWLGATVKDANGCQLTTEAEWEYAAAGGVSGHGFLYSGSNSVDEVAWYYQNSGDAKLPPKWHRHILEGNHDRTHAIGTKMPNELGIYDMSGNVREWCWDWYGELKNIEGQVDPRGSQSGSFHVWKGGCWMASDFCCAISFRGSNNPSNYRSDDQGLRVCRGE